MKKQSLFVKLYFAAMLVFFAPIGTNAQVTIGSDNLPSEFSLLDLSETDEGTSSRALHLPRLDDDAREALFDSGEPNQPAEGLMIFNTYTRCLEFWNGEEWISLCDGDTPPIRRCPVLMAPDTWLTFMCHNLGAGGSVRAMTPVQQAAAAPETNRGWLFQWGRTAHGHQVRTPLSENSTTTTALSGAALDASTGQPTGVNVDRFILSNTDWRTPQLDDLWTRNDGDNDPCPPGWRVPTAAELQAVFGTGSPISQTDQLIGNNYVRWIPATDGGTSGIMVTPQGHSTPTLFLPAAGIRHRNTGLPASVDTRGYYWSSTASGANARVFWFTNTDTHMSNVDRASGYSVRCVEVE